MGKRGGLPLCIGLAGALHNMFIRYICFCGEIRKISTFLPQKVPYLEF